MSASCNNSLPSDGNYLVVATTNENKFFEIRTALGQTAIPLYSLRHFPGLSAPEENGTDFSQNARIKARAYFDAIKKPVLAEDSGLVIPSLDGFPGIHSARIGETDPERIAIVLQKLAPGKDRAAFYQCNLVFMNESGIQEVEASCRGRITEEPVGDRGFGYDPIFLPDGSSRTFGQMSIREKSGWSHRGKAAQKIIPHLLDAFRR